MKYHLLKLVWVLFVAEASKLSVTPVVQSISDRRTMTATNFCYSVSKQSALLAVDLPAEMVW